MTILLPSALAAERLPRVSSSPGFHSSAGEEAIELAASAGLVLDDWQAWVLTEALGERVDGTYAALEVGVCVPRQNGKGGILEALELFWLFLSDDMLIVHTAHEFKTAKEAYLRVRGLIETTPDLDRRVKICRDSAQDTSIELLNGKRLRFLPRSSGSGRGFSGDKIVLDEAMFLQPQMMAALLPTLSTRALMGRNPQLWYTGSAGFVSSDVWKSVRERGIAGDDRLAYFEWSSPADADLDDVGQWERANPAWGYRIGEEFCRVERAAMPDREFAAERMGIWDDGQLTAVFDAPLWADRAKPGLQAEGTVAFAVEVSEDRTKASIAVCGEHEGSRLGAVVAYQSGTGWVVPKMVELQDKARSCAVIVDPAGPAVSLIGDLEAAGVKVTPLQGREMVQACGAFYDDVLEGGWFHVDQTVLNIAVSAAQRKTVGDAWRWARRNATDVSPLVAVTLARLGYTQYGNQDSKYDDSDLMVLGG